MADTKQTPNLSFEYQAFAFELDAASNLMQALAYRHRLDMPEKDRAEGAAFYERIAASCSKRAEHYRMMAVGDYSWKDDDEMEAA